MPFNEDGSRKTSTLYKKSSGFKMKRSSAIKALAPGQHPNVGRGSGSRAPGQRPNVGRGRGRNRPNRRR